MQLPRILPRIFDVATHLLLTFEQVANLGVGPNFCDLIVMCDALICGDVRFIGLSAENLWLRAKY